MGPFLVTILLFVGSIAGQSDFHSQLTPEELQRYFGVKVTENVPSYELVSPVHVKGSPHRPSFLAPKESLNYNLTAFGEDFTLHLDHNNQLIAPGCLVHYLQSNGSRKVRPCPTHEKDCYYHGRSLNHDGSDVSVSTCNGALHGLIRLPDRNHDLWIQPIAEEHVHRARRSTRNILHRPHLVYKRAIGDRRCATNGVPEVRGLVSNVISTSRKQRSAGDKYAEMLLVADPTMHRHYQDTLRPYLLTVANVAARILLDPSIGTPVHFTVVKIQILEVDQPGLVIEEDTDKTLERFCQWQERSNPRDDSHPQHHDGAALFTRLDLVHQGVQSTTGYATVAGMCGANTRCSINEDNGLSVGVTLAHETGHSLGMVHDGSGNNCENGKNVMSSMGGGGTTAMVWSPCSRQAFADYLASSKSACLNDHPQNPVALSKDLPGVVYDGDEQCEMYAGQGSTLCLGTNMVHGDECSHLVCFDPNQAGSCVGDSVPRMDGTMCGDRKYCIHGQCVDIGPNGPQPVQGGWSAWQSQWSPCSRSCGGGVRVRRRKCDNPKPRLGGRDCDGSDIIAEMCNMKECKNSQTEYRASQCAMTDSIPVNGQRYHWIPVNMLGEQECELHCQIDGQRTVLLRSIEGRTWYQDGTSCVSESSSFGRCVDGKCREFGCDGKTGSSYQFDRCGVCGGQGNTCTKQSGRYTQGRKHEFVTFVTVPKGSTSVKITNSNRFTMMSVKVGGRRVFNEDGDSSDPTGVYTANGLVVSYRSGSGGMETIAISESLPEAVEAQVWRKFADTEFQGVSPQIDYEYFVPTSGGPRPDYVWKAQNGACTKSCGGGVYNQVITCTRRNSGAQVDDYLCDLRQKPSLTGSPCNNQACPPRWRAGHFGQCSKTCGGGQRSRPVDCVREEGGVEVVVAATLCPANSRPQASQGCNVGVACPAVWKAGNWGACSMTCGKGVHTRSVKCVTDDEVKQEVDNSHCPRDNKPDVSQACVNAICSPDIKGDACKDTDATCASYGLTMCQDFADFAKQSCMKHCAFCSPDGSTGGSCEDKNADCAGYGQSICTGEYAEWAKGNCQKLCGFCSSGTPASCEDKSTDCEGYGKDICTGQYAEWAKTECAKFCGHCGTTTTTTTATINTNNNNGACEDKSGNCEGYGKDICTGEYAAWAGDNCAKFCGHCGGSDHSQGGATCEDKADNCAAYGQTVCTGTYAAWASENCQKFCGQCPQSSGDPDCVDKREDCTQYGSDTCSSYPDWAADNCPKFCNMCSRRRRRSALAPPPPRPTCNTVLRDHVGSLALIGQPLDTPCTHIIAAPLGSVVRLNFTAINIDCEQGDWLAVKEEGGRKIKGGKRHRNLCQGTSPVQWTTHGHLVTLQLRVATPGHGYNLTYTILLSPSPLSPHSCDRLLTEPSGLVSSPGFPGEYPNDRLCVTTIVAPPNYSVRLNFDLFSLDGEQCGKDSVTVYDTMFNTRDIFCGTRRDLTWVSKGNKVKVIFASDHKTRSKGFLASYHFISP